MKKRFLLLSLLASFFISQAQPVGCNVQAVRNAFAAAGNYVELTGVQGQPCSMYFVYTSPQNANASEVAAQTLGAHMVVFNDAAENTAVVAALNTAGFISANSAVWIGYTDQTTEGNWLTLDGSPYSYTNWSGGEPNNNGQASACCAFADFIGGCQTSEAWRCQYGEDCVQIYSGGTWNDLPCDRQSVSVIEVNLCPQITTAVPAQAVCAGYQTYVSATTILGSQPFTYVWNELPSNVQVGSSTSITITPAATTSYQVQATDRYGCLTKDTATVITQVCTGPPGCDLVALRAAYANAGYSELNGVVGQDCSLYFINNTSQSSIAAEAAAQTLGAHMVVFNSAAENTAVVAALNAANVISSADAIWLGYTDQANEGTWLPLDGTPLQYTNWNGGEPNNSGQGATCCSFPDFLGGCSGSQAFKCANGEDCVQIYSSGAWNDLACNTNSKSVIEVNLCPQMRANNDTALCGGNPLQLRATTILGSSPFSYIWNPGGLNTNPATVTPLANTAYVGTVTDRWGCFAQDSVIVTILGGSLQTFAFNPDPACTNSAVTVNYTGNSTIGASYTWGFDGGTVLSGTGQGPYNVTWANSGTKNVTLNVTDGGCVSPQKTVQLNVTPNPVADAGPDVVVCSGGTVQIGIAPVGGNTYRWSPGINLSDSTISNPTFRFSNTTSLPITFQYIVGLISGTCYGTDTVNITVNPVAPTTITPAGPIPVCAGGSLVIAADSTFASYTWSDTTFANSITVTQPKNVFLIGVAANGCQFLSNTINVTYAQPQGTTISASGPIPVCAGGSIIISSDSVYVTYVWSDTTFANSTTVTQLKNVFLVGIAATGCQYLSNTITVTFNQPQTTTVTASGPLSFCQGLSVDLTADSIYPTYNWSNGTSTNTITVSQTSTHTLSATDAANCQYVSAPINVVVNPNPLLTFVTSSNESCFGESDGSITVSANTGTSPYGYSWNTTPVQTSATAINLSAGSYDVVVADANSCTATGNFAIQSPAEVVASIDNQTNPTCYQFTDGSVTVSATGGVTPFSYVWSNGNSGSTLVNLGGGSYTLTVSDANNCSGTLTATIIEPDQITFANLEFDSVKYNTELELNLNVSPAGTYTYNWNPSLYLTCNNCSNPIFSAIRNMEYQITVTNSFGCTVTGTVNVNLQSEKQVFIPNAFTPDGINTNDYFLTYAVGVNFYHMSVFNRWGEKVFETNNITEGWDGRYRGKESYQGVYSYVVELTFLDGENQKKIGTVTLIR